MANFPFFRSSVPTGNPDFFNIAAEKQRRLEGYKKAWQAYLAELPDPLVINSAGNDNVKVSPVRAAIETSVYFLFGRGITFQISPESTQNLDIHDDGDMPDYLTDINRCWKANRKEAKLHELGLSGSIHGDCFVKILPKGAGPKGDLPKLVVLDPANVDVETDPDDCERVTKWIIEYNTEDDNGDVLTRTQEITPVYPAGAIEGEDAAELIPDTLPVSWEIRNFEQLAQYSAGVGWHPSINGADKVQVGPTKKWPYSWPPIEHCNNIEVPHMFWGLPDVDDASIDLVQSLQRANSSLTKIIRIHGSPRMYAKGIMPELVGDIDVSPDNIITLPPGEDTDLRVLTLLADIGSFTDYIATMRAQLLEQIGVPAIALGQMGEASTSTSGISLSILYAPILQKTELKRVSYGDMLDRLNWKLLVLMGHDDSTMNMDDLQIVWPEVMPGSAYLERQTLIEDQKLGLSNDTAMVKLGYDPKKEQQQMLDEKRAILELESEFLAMQPGNVGVTDPNGNPVDQNPTPVPKLGGKLKPTGPGGNNNPTGNGSTVGSKMGAAGNSTPKNSDNPSTSASRGGPKKG